MIRNPIFSTQNSNSQAAASLAIREIPFAFVEGQLISDEDLCAFNMAETAYYPVGINLGMIPYAIQSTTPGIDHTFTAYGIEAGLAAAPVGTAYASADPYAVLGSLSETQINQLVWLLQNGFPAISATALFSAAGVDQSAAPVLNDTDAFSAMQLAIWGLGAPLLSLNSCGTTTLDPKNARIAQTANYILTQAEVYGSDAPELPHVRILTDATTATCSNGISLCVGPFTLSSNLALPIQLTADTCGIGLSILDVNGIPRTSFLAGERFYVCALRERVGCSFCLRVAATVTGTQTVPLVFQDSASSATRHLAAILTRAEQLLAETTLNIFVDGAAATSCFGNSPCCAFNPACTNTTATGFNSVAGGLNRFARRFRR